MERSIALSPVEEVHCGARGVPETVGMAALFTGRPPGADALRARVGERWGGFPRLRRVLLDPAPPARLRGHRWLPLDRFDTRRHVHAVHAADGGDGGDRAAFTALLGRLVARPLPVGLPPWRLTLVAGADRGRFAVVLTAHHALLDGRSLEILLSSLFDGTPGRGGRSGTGVRAVEALSAAHPDRVRPGLPRPSAALGPGRALPLPRGRRPEPDLAWTEVDADAVRAARRALPGLGATLNEVLLAAAAGALRTVHGDPERWPGAPRPLYGAFPVDLRTPREDRMLGTAVSAVRVPLPVTAADPGERLAACRGALAAFGPVHGGADTVRRAVGAAARLGPWAVRLLAALSCSPGFCPVTCLAFGWPRGPWSLDGRPLERIVPLPPVLAPGSVCLALTDHAGAYTLTAVTHTLPGLARPLADALARELTGLARPPEPEPEPEPEPVPGAPKR
ncbi:wax ester/triacylglycerol synthase domain-containing protein [Streptomyces radiopugnans]|uniref:Wax ester synthase-like Acyl-CoA acyltransferase domain-containing protein n=1 Tax=Streptomyces radiopugnans TaxID=403935 RepID=A0A1H9GAR3_9ACTN|nr:wax ester/triacylglycerol synthase domain-containing protein [Streptomyces radiopugnans]SEQ47265.1 Wax ester synthase-like Acyl-CoA acyltransferase domain-containing protein [Streptomyces radiopugnans]